MLMIFYAICFSEFLKRFIYINGPTHNLLYYSCIFIPTIVVFIYILIGDKKLDKYKFIIFCCFVIIQFFVVLLDNREKLGKLIVFLCSNIIYVFPLILKKSPQINNNKCNYLFLILLIITIIYGLTQHIIGYFIWDKNWSDFSPSVIDLFATSNWGGFNRVYSLFSGIQDFAIFLLFTTLILLIDFTNKKLRLLVILCLLTGLYIAGSKSMMISLSIALVIYLLRSKINPLFLFVILFILPYTIIMSLYIPYKSDIEFALINIGGLFNFGTILPRLEIFYDFFSSFTSSNLLGCGSGCMEGVVDNMYIRILIENGIIGFILFMSLIYLIIRQLFYIIRIQNVTSICTQTNGIKNENMFLFLLFITMSISMYSGELLNSRFSVIVYIYIIICINNKYVKLKKKISQ
jgi:hypothetical protein